MVRELGTQEEQQTMLGPKCTTDGRIRQYLVALTASLGALCCGTVLAWTAPALPQILIPEYANETEHQEIVGAPGFRISESEGAIVGSVLTIGGLLSALPVGILAGKIGRKLTIIILAITFILSWVLIVFSINMEMVVAGRFFAGIGLGGACVVVPMYVGEIAEASTRGILGAFFNIFLCSGMLVACVVGALTNWVGLSLILGIFPILLAIGTCFLPDTPSYLVRKGRAQQAEQVLQKLRGVTDVSNELKAIQKDLDDGSEEAKSLKDILTNRANIRALIAVCGVLAFQQLCGINAVVFYMDPIFKAAGSTLSSSVAGITITSVQLIVAYLSLFIIEKADRRFYLMLSSIGMMLGITGLGMFFHLKSTGMDVSRIGFLPLSCCVLFMVMFSLGYGPIPWMLLGELFSNDIKGFGSGLGVVLNWVCAFIVTMSFPLLNLSIGVHNTFYIFGGILASATLFVFFLVPETRGKTFKEIQQELSD